MARSLRTIMNAAACARASATSWRSWNSRRVHHHRARAGAAGPARRSAGRVAHRFSRALRRAARVVGVGGEWRTRRELQLEEHWFHKGGVVLKFAGVDTISDAEQLAGWEVQVPREQRAELEEGAAYVSEMVGCEVWIATEPDSKLLGDGRDVQFERRRGSAAGGTRNAERSENTWCRTRKSL